MTTLRKYAVIKTSQQRRMTMSLVSHVEELQRKHHTLQTEIEAVERLPGTDHLEILTLKRKKLKLKDEIRRLAS